jgi:hypothetical protein
MATTGTIATTAITEGREPISTVLVITGTGVITATGSGSLSTTALHLPFTERDGDPVEHSVKQQTKCQGVYNETGS